MLPYLGTRESVNIHNPISECVCKVAIGVHACVCMSVCKYACICVYVSATILVLL